MYGDHKEFDIELYVSKLYMLKMICLKYNFLEFAVDES